MGLFDLFKPKPKGVKMPAGSEKRLSGWKTPKPDSKRSQKYGPKKD